MSELMIEEKAIQKFQASLLNMTDSQLSAALDRHLMDTVENIAKAGMVVVELERRGHDLSRIKPGILDRLRRVGRGTLLAQLLFDFSDDPGFCNVLKTLTIEDQRKAMGPIEVITDSGRTRIVDPREMTPDERRQVFARGRIRSPTEQRSYLEDLKKKKSRKPVPDEDGITMDRKRQILIVGEYEISLERLLEYASNLAA